MENGSNGSALAVVEPSNSLEANVGVLMRRATDVAGVCRDIVQRTAQAIQGRKYVRVEGWQSIAVAYGCVLSARDVEAVPGGIRAIGEVRRMSDGVVIATADGFVGDDEKTWASRPMYARRAMAQTRAQSRAGRTAFSFVVTLIDSNLSTTPFEEVDGLVNAGTVEPPAPVRGNAALKNALRPSPPKATAPSEPPPHEDADFRADGLDVVRAVRLPGSDATHDRSASFGFGKSKGVALADLDEGSLKFYEGCLKRDLADASKSQWHAKTSQQLANLQAEMRFRGL
jgi:hypothetical protein